ncbi:hypothetical protein CBP51_05065 [Cellvibrio mixtus]|uniref:TauD/TfdA-like domain-containing protein n=1 Tax=Cellvibrio mixtus TaxID=39650 RepID=A0A266Q993_9GAMM|nr:TauD/TfdA family dioxygenase [Cellvibrio mixtus]OZY86400.1 hypothetical protein CBP51_05065 [Cellvibrio mixtus]
MTRPTFKSRSKADRKPIAFDGGNLVSFSPLFEDESGPLLIKANVPNIDLGKWLKDKYDLVNQYLYDYGAILYRDFNLHGDDEFLKYMQSVPYEMLNYLERSSPRKTIANKVYTSTIYPADQVIPLHNENTASITFALKVWFFCNKSANSGGETPIADSRRILQRIDPGILTKFRKLGWLLVRNYGNHLGYDWEEAFDGMDKESVERYFRSNQIDWKWLSDGGLQTRQQRSATIIHPVTGKESWFNHVAFWHPANLAPEIRDFMLKEVGEDGLPYNTYFGDGSKIPDEVANHLRDVYLLEKRKFSWQEGDLLLVDNVLTSHGRESYEGERAIRVAMAEPHTRPLFVPDLF